MNNKMLFNLLISSKFIIADALYSTFKLAKYLIGKNLIPIISIKNSLHQKVRNPYIKYKKRNFIENTFAKIKLSFYDRENTKNPNLAKKFILMKLLFLNFVTLLTIFLFFFFRILSNYILLFQVKYAIINIPILNLQLYTSLKAQPTYWESEQGTDFKTGFKSIKNVFSAPYLKFYNTFL